MSHNSSASRLSAIMRPLNRRGALATILDAEIVRVRRDRDFDRIEAYVTFLMKRRGAMARPVTVYTNVDARGGRIRERLLRDAAGLAHQMMAQPATLGRAA